MAGRINSMIKEIVDQKSRGNAIIAKSIRTKMTLKGINVDKYTNTSEDDPKIIKALRTIAEEFGIKL